jgi:cytochrome c oxidase subunit 1
MGDHHHGPATGVTRWLFTTNHKDIGTMYLWFSFAMFLLGGFFAMVIRAELFQPGMQLVEPAFFNQMTTLHGLVMVFGAIMPSFVGLANWLIPMMIGAPDMALPRMNNWSFWILPPAFLMLASTLLWKAARLRLAGLSMPHFRRLMRRRRSPSSFLPSIFWVCHPSWAQSISLPL